MSLIKTYTLMYEILNKKRNLGVVEHAFSLVLRRQRQENFGEFQASLIFIMSSRPASTA